MSHYFQKTILVVPFERRSTNEPGYQIKINNLEIIPLTHFNGTGLKGKLKFIPKIPGIITRIWSAYNRSDILSYWLSGYVGTLGLLVQKIRRTKPGFAIIGTDWPERIRQLGNSVPRRIASHFVEWMVRWLIKGIPVFAVGHLAEKYKARHPFAHQDVQTTLSNKHIKEDIKLKFSEPLRILFVGRLASGKGLEYLLEAIRICVAKGLQLHLTIVGDGNEREALEAYTKKNGLEDFITLEGFIPMGERLWGYYDQADIFVMPSLSEGVPKVLMEAMARGLVIITTNVGGIPTLIKDGFNGILVEKKSSQALAEAIERVTHNPSKSMVLAQNALDSSREYTIEDHTQKLINNLYNDLKTIGWEIF